MTAPFKKRLLTVDEYNRMFEAGILPEKGLELINGEIIEMSPIGAGHAAVVEKIKDLLVISLHKKAICRIQNPIITNDHSEPEPDIAIVKYRPDYYAAQHPQAEDVLLIIEVADSTLEFDRLVKIPLYATAGIQEYWIVNLKDKEIEAYRTPQDLGYKYKEICKQGEFLKSKVVSLTINMNEIFD